jgi:hypothetical protein
MFIRHSGQVDDAQPPVAQCRLIVHEKARIVWAAMRDRVAHQRHPGSIVCVQPNRRDNSRNPAHSRGPFQAEAATA